MKSIRFVLGSALLAAFVLAVPGSASARVATTTLSGTFGGTIVYEGCAVTPAPAEASGTWTVVLHGGTANATFDIDVNDVPHVAYTYPNMKRLSIAGTVFTAYGPTQAGPLTITLFNDNRFTYVIAPYSYGGVTCARVTFPGTLSS